MAVDAAPSERFLRQMLVAEIGEGGQQRLAHASAAVLTPGLRGETAALYAERAGFQRLTGGTVDLERLAPASLVTTPAAREVLAGARLALREIRCALDAPGADGAPTVVR
jgi:hypothetical protein